MTKSLSGLVTSCYYCLKEGVTYARNLSSSCTGMCAGSLATQAVRTVDRYGDGWGDGFYVLFVDGVSVLKGSQRRGRYECSWVDTEDAPCSVASQKFFVASRVDDRLSNFSKAALNIELDWRKGRHHKGGFSAAVALLAWPSVSTENDLPAQQHNARLTTPFSVYEPRWGRERAPADTAWLSFNESFDEGLVLAAEYSVAWGKYALIMHELSITAHGWFGGSVRVWDSIAQTYKLAAGTVAVGTRLAIENPASNQNSTNSNPTPIVGEIELILKVYYSDMADMEPELDTVQVYRIERPPLIKGFFTDSNFLQNEQYVYTVGATKRDNATFARSSNYTDVSPGLKRRFEYKLYAGFYDILMVRVNCWPYWKGGIIVLDRADDRVNHLLVYEPIACNKNGFVDKRLEQALVPLSSRDPRRLLTPNETTSGGPTSNPPGMTAQKMPKVAKVAPNSETHQKQAEGSSKELSRGGVGDLSVAIIIAIIFIGVMAFTALCIATFLLMRFVRSAHSPRERRRGRRNGRAHIFNNMIAQGHDDDPLDDARLVDFEEEDDESAKESTFTVYRDNPTSPRISSRSEIELADWRDRSGNDTRRELPRTPAPVELVSLSPSSHKRGHSATRDKVEATRTYSGRKLRPVTLIELGDYEPETAHGHTAAAAAPEPASEVPNDDGAYPASSSNLRQLGAAAEN